MQSTFRYDVIAGTAGDTYVLSHPGTGFAILQWEGVAGVSRIIEVTVWDNPAHISMSYDGTTFGPDIEIDQDDPPVQIPHAARAIRIKNVTAGLNARYQIVGFW